MKNYKRILATVLLVAMMASIFAVTAYAANGFSVHYQKANKLLVTENAAFPQYSVKKAPASSGLKAGDVLYCINREVAHASEGDSTSLNDDGITESEYWTNLSYTAKRAITLVSIYERHSTQYEQAAAQAMIWEATAGGLNVDRFVAGYRGYIIAGAIEATAANYGSEQANKLAAAYDELVNRIMEHTTTPSFDGSTVTMELDEETGLYTAVLTDTNNVLDKFTISVSGITAKKDGNTLTLTSQTPVTSDIKVTMMKEKTAVGSGVILYGNTASGSPVQEMVGGCLADPVPASVTVKVATGTVILKKTSSDGVIADVKFTVTDEAGAVETVTTDETGTITVRGLVVGQTYTISEVENDLYMPQPAQKVTIKSGENTVTFANVAKQWQLKINKVDSNGNRNDIPKGDLKGAEFALYCDGKLVETMVTDANGLTGLSAKHNFRSGVWTVKEIKAPVGYAINPTVFTLNETDKPGQFTEVDNIITMTVEEDMLTGKISLFKHSEFSGDAITAVDAFGDIAPMDYNVEAGAKFEVYLQSAGSYEAAPEGCRDILTTDEDGYAETKSMPYGKYVVHQVEGAEYASFVDDFEVMIDGSKAAYCYVLNNIKWTGSVKLNKISAYSEAPIAGVIFRIFDANKEVVADMVTDKEGNCSVDNLPCGKYSVKEISAPEGYKIDTTEYEFDLTENGQVATFTIENIGTGKLVIHKTDVSTGAALPNAGFRIKDADGKTVVEGRTDANGNCTFALDCGKYTYEEFDAPAGYIIDPAPHAFEIKENGDVVKAEMSNKAVPDTGLSGLPTAAWGALALVMVMLAGALVIIPRVTHKKRK